MVKNWSRKEYEKKEICKCLGNNCKIALFKKKTHIIKHVHVNSEQWFVEVGIGSN